MSGYQKEKRIILDYYQALDSANDTRITEVLDTFTSKNYLWRAFHPFGLQTDVNSQARHSRARDHEARGEAEASGGRDVQAAHGGRGRAAGRIRGD